MARISRKGSELGLQAFNRKIRFSDFGIRAETGAPKAFGAPARLKLEKVSLAISLLIGGASPEAQSGTEEFFWAVQFDAKLNRADE